MSRQIADMRFVKKLTLPDFQAKNFTPLFSPNFNSLGDKNTKKWVKNVEIYTAGKNFTLPPAVTAVTNLTSVKLDIYKWIGVCVLNTFQEMP